MSEAYETELARLRQILMDTGVVHRPSEPHMPINPESGSCLGCFVAAEVKQVLMLPGLGSADLYAIASLCYRVAKAARALGFEAGLQAQLVRAGAAQRTQNRAKPPARTNTRLVREVAPRGRKGGSR